MHVGPSSPSGYVLWIVGLVTVALTMVQAARRGGGPAFRFPTLTPQHWSTIVAWLVVLGLVYAALAHR